MRTAMLLTLLIATLSCSLFAAPALALRDRVFVASYGSDSNPCTYGSPCKTFQQAIDAASVGGEVTAIDSAGFGTFTIAHSITITSPNGVEAGIAAPASGAAAITINAASGDIINLNGLTLDGDGVTSANGILFNAGGKLTVENCVIRNFSSGVGIEFDSGSASQLWVSSTLISDNAAGINLYNSSGGAIGVLNHVEIKNNQTDGLYVNTSTQTITVTVIDSVSANNGDGIYVLSTDGGAATVMVRNSTFAGNGGSGLISQGSGAQMWVTRSTITGNLYGWTNSDSGVLMSFGDNNIIGNTNDNTMPSSAGGYK
jgi:hypothetical protein